MGQTSTMYFLIGCTEENRTAHSSWGLLSRAPSSSEAIFHVLPFYQHCRRRIFCNLFYCSCSSRTDSSEAHPLNTLRGAAKTSFNKAGLIHHHPGPQHSWRAPTFSCQRSSLQLAEHLMKELRKPALARQRRGKMPGAGARRTGSIGASGHGGISRGFTRAGVQATHTYKKHQGEGLFHSCRMPHSWATWEGFESLNLYQFPPGLSSRLYNNKSQTIPM